MTYPCAARRRADVGRLLTSQACGPAGAEGPELVPGAGAGGVDEHQRAVIAFQHAWNPADPPPAITVHVVAGLGPGFLVEIDAIAVV